MTCLQCSRKSCLAFVPIFKSLKSEELMELSKIITHRTYKKGEAVYIAGELNDNLFIVRKGKVKITYVSGEGREQIVRIIQEGDFFGELSLFRNSPLPSNAEALEMTEVCILEGRLFKQILEKSPSLVFNLFHQLSERLERAELTLSQISHHDVGQRLAAFLLQCAEKSGKESFEFPVNKTDAASMLGTTRETLSRKLSSFQREGYIKQSGRQITICDAAALEDLLFS